MANVTITGLAPATALTGTEVLAIDQSGSTVKTTAQDIADLASGGGGGDAAPTFGVTTNGVLGFDIDVTYTQRAFVSKDVNGAFTTEIANYATFSYYASGGGGYGGYGGGSSGTTATNISFSSRYLASVIISGSTVVTTFSFPDTIVQDDNMSGLNFYGSALTTINFPLLERCRGINISNNSPALTTLNFPSLVKFTGYSGIMINASTAITSLSSANFPVLTEFALQVYEPGFLQVINLPSVTLWKSQYLSSNGMSTGASALQTYSLPNIVTYQSSYLYFDGHFQLATVVLGTVGTLKTCGAYGSTNITFNNCALSEASVNGILILLASLDGTDGTTLSENGSINLTNGTSAAPSGAGLTAKATLLARGFTISHN